ncbi:golgi-body localization protein domain-containing protein [Thamnidium elegans]|nr:golgi-body localization protein domain-containing protein [Thamnidium elegans]
MSLSFYNCICIVLAFCLARICLKSLLSLRYHFKFGRIGFFSINDIQYHHHKSSETALWSVKVGKLKLRLRRRPTLSSPTPFITIYVADIQVQLHSLAALAALRQQKEKTTRNKRFSRVSSSLKKIPWWYSLSIVKYVIKFTSALPAQLLMAGLANYVDVQVQDFKLNIEQQAEIKVQHVNFSSVLFANVTIPSSTCNSVPNSVPSSPNPSIDNFHTLSERLTTLHSSYQRHSLKRAQHLFKEKFFEIMVKVGTISLTTPERIEMLTLPSGVQIDVSCHLSAGCVTLKDVDINTRVDTFKLKLNLLLDLIDQLKQSNLTNNETAGFDQLYQKQQDKHHKANIIQLLRSVTLCIDNTIVEVQHQDEYHSTLQLEEIHLNGIAENFVAGVDPYYKLQLLIGMTCWTLFDKSVKDLEMKMVTLPEIKLNVNLAQSLIMPATNKKPIAIDFEESLFWNSEDSGPNQKYINIQFTLLEPILYLDVTKADILAKLALKKQYQQPQRQRLKSNKQNNTSTFFDLPRASVSIQIDNPRVQMKSACMQMGIISWSDITLEASGTYSAQKNRPVSIISRFSEPVQPTTSNIQYTHLDDHTEYQPNSNPVQRIQSQSRPSWTNLFRRSWKSKVIDEAAQKNAIEWHYKASTRIVVQNTCFEDTIDSLKPKLKKQEKTKPSNAFISMKEFESTVFTRLNVNFVEDVAAQRIHVVWDPDAHHINVEMTVDTPVLNLWTNTTNKEESQLEFWVNSIASQIKTNMKNNNTSTKTQVNTPHNITEIFGFISILKTSMKIKNTLVVLEGVDKGLKGKRPIPTGFLDNAPEKDICVRVIASIKQVSFVFNGSRIFAATRGKHQLSHSIGSVSTEDSDDDNETIAASEGKGSHQVSFGTSRLSLRHIVLERVFRSELDPNQPNWHHHEDKKSVLLWISRINTRTEMVLEVSQRIILIPSVVVKKNGIQYSISNHYTGLILAHSTMDLIKRCFPKKNTEFKSPTTAKKVTVQNLQFQINRSDVHVFLPGGDTELYIRMDSLRTQWHNDVEHQGEVPSTAIRNLTLYGAAPRRPGHWDQLLEMDNMRFAIEKDVDFNTGTLKKSNQLSMSKLYLRIPYGYELSSFVDSMVTLIKAVKASHTRIYKGNSFLFFGPTEKKTPVVIPHMQLVCDLFTFQFEDDPFEARLRSIWKTGLIEQSNRNAIQEAFEVKAQTLMQNPSDKRRGSDRAESIYIDEETDNRVNDAWQGLQEHNSKSWKRHIDAALLKEASTYERIQSANYRHVNLSGQMDEVFDDIKDEKTQHLSEMFCIEIVDLPIYPALLDITMKNACLGFKPPDFDLEETREFIYNVGKKQPLDTPLSTLIPFHLNWKSGETWAQLRDYPVPFILVPPTNTEDSNLPAWTLSGNYVFADDLGDLDGTRCINISIVDENNASYSINVARTSTPLKFFSVVDIEVHNSGLSQICWCVSYQPAIQDISRVMDTFTRAPVDPSEKIGFWDKIRLIIHTRAKIKFVGGGDLAIVMKGTRDPYDMSEKGFGLAKVWRNDVVWLFGVENPEGEFMQIISRDYAFGVPDLVRGGYTASYIIAADNSGKELSENSQKQMRQSTSMSSFNSSTPSKDNENESRFVKIALKLSGGIRMGLGCQLERMCKPHCEICNEDGAYSDEAREVHKSKLLTFLPHYKVKLKAPQNVLEKDYDAYRGFRSDYIHVSLSVIKFNTTEPENEKGNVTGNSMHLTPGFIDHFVSWFRLFGGAMGYPVRDGSLFPKSDTRPTKKFGRHMSTMKYKIVVNPLTIGYFIKDENVVANEVTTEELGDSVGLKGFVKFFCIDMHQRREVINVANYKLDQKRLKANWPVSEAEVQLKNIDLRAVRANYSGNGDESLSSSGAENISIPVPADQNYLSDDSDNGLDMMEGLNYQCNNDSDSSDWVDLDDFIEMDVVTPAVLPTIQVLPFAFSPCIYYLRQNNRDDIQKYKYLHNTHNCILGTAVDTREMQMNLLHDRSRSIDVQIRKHQTRLHNIELKRLQHGTDEKLLEELSDSIVEKTRILYEKRELLQRYLKELSTQAMPDIVHGKKSDTYTNSTIFGKDSLTQWEELMGYFKVRYIAHNPQILWNNSIRNILYHAMDLRDHRRALSYYMTSRTVKFLRDLIEASDLRYGDSLKPFVLDDEEGGMDRSMAEDLIAKLLSEQDTKFFAPNETEEETPLGGRDSDEVDMSRSENVNNPKMQLKTIPSGYVMKSSYLVDLLNPQISLQSDCDPNNIVLVANERAQVKGFNIIDETDPDVEMEMVKHRTVVSLDNLQIFVAKKEQFDSVDLLLDNHYGAKESDHWLAWIPPEMLISYVKHSDKFQRIGDRISATLQYDKYNPLRIKTNTTAYSQVHPFEDRCDSVQLNFPKLKVTADSAQYNAVYQVTTDLLLYKEPAKKERLARLREIMMAADRASLFEVTEKIVDLQNRSRQLIHARDQYRQNMALLDESRIEEFKSIRLTLYDTLEELYLGMEAIKLMQSNQRRDYHEPKTNLKFVLCAEKLIWEMLSKGETPLSEWTLTNFNFIFVSKEDHSATNTLEVDVVQVKNTSPSPVFVDILGPYYDARKPYDFSRHKMLRCYFVTLAPVGGIPVIQHLEVNLHPLRVQMTHSFGKALSYYLFPPEKRHKPIESANMVTSNSTPTASNSGASNELEMTGISNIVLQHSNSEKTDKDVIKSSSSMKNFDTQPAVGSVSNLQKPNSNMNSPPREDIDPDTQTDTSSNTLTNSSKKFKKQNLHKLTKSKTMDDLSVMKKRASSNRAFILVKVPGARHCLSYQGPKDKNIEDLRDFAFEQPTLEFRNETWSWFELASNVKKDFMRAALLHNSTALLKEKLLRRHPRENSKLIESSISYHSVPTYVPEPEKHSTASLYEADNNSENTESSRDDTEYLDRDVISLNSAHSHENWDTESPEALPKRSHIWSKLTKPKKSNSTADQKNGKSVPDPVLHNSSNSNHLTIDTLSHVDNHQRILSTGDSPIVLTRSISAVTRHLHDDDQLTAKGRYLLGKYYNGPTQWLAPKSKMKGKQTFRK